MNVLLVTTPMSSVASVTAKWFVFCVIEKIALSSQHVLRWIGMGMHTRARARQAQPKHASHHALSRCARERVRQWEEATHVGGARRRLSSVDARGLNGPALGGAPDGRGRREGSRRSARPHHGDVQTCARVDAVERISNGQSV